MSVDSYPITHMQRMTEVSKDSSSNYSLIPFHNRQDSAIYAAVNRFSHLPHGGGG